MSGDKELTILYSLLDDPQEAVREEVDRRIMSLGEGVIGPLQDLDAASGGLNDARVRNLSREIRHVTAARRFTEYLAASGADTDLEEGVFILAKYGYPGIDVREYTQRLDGMAEDVRRLAGSHATAGNLLLQLRTHLFSELGYVGNRSEYYDPENTYFNRVIDRRLGIPISLATLMMLVGRRIDLPLHGVGMPMHFLLLFDDGERNFFIDAFNSGSMITKDQCRQMLVRSGFSFSDSMLEPVTSRYMVERMLRNLHFACKQRGEVEEAANLMEFLILFDPAHAEEMQGDADQEEEGMDEDDE